MTLKDCQGNHTIEKIISVIDERLLDSFYNIVLENFIFLANHCFALSVVKKVIIHSRNQNRISYMSSLLIENALSLVQNSFGNYSVSVGIEVSTIIICFRPGGMILLKKFSISCQKICKHYQSKNIQVM